MKLRTILALGAIVAVPVVALAQGMNMPGMTPAAPAANEAVAAYQAVNAAMMETMNVELTGDPDRDFVLMMIPHHQGAVDMARVVLQYGTDPQIRAMAEAIIAAQEAEIAAFQAWLAAH
ncbi:MAG: CopM family metallochaperone [Bauldia sp.]